MLNIELLDYYLLTIWLLYFITRNLMNFYFPNQLAPPFLIFPTILQLNH